MRIQRPDETEIRVEHHSYYKGKSQKAVAAASCVSSTVWSRRLDPNETIVKNPPFEVISEMASSVETNQPEVGKGIVGMINRYAREFGLIDKDPLDILKSSTDSLRRITSEQIKNFNGDEKDKFLADLARLQEVTRRLTDIVMRADEFKLMDMPS